jgi:hypothetical protein
MRNILVITALLLAQQTFSCTSDGLEGFLPKNDMRIPVGSKNTNSMTEERFNEIIDKVNEVYAPIVKGEGARLKFNRKWTDDTVNASAQQFWKLWVVNMYGGLARHPDVSEDGFALVVCHELGHHLAGAPTNNFPMKWASNEGQSDYFASLKCFRKVFGGDDNMNIVSNMEVDASAEKQCQASWSNQEDISLCVRAAMAGKSLATLLGRGTTISFDTPDANVVERTNDRHPAGQCRLDTYFQGSLCEAKRDDDVSRTDALIGTCNRSTGHSVGVRPLCWYKP